MTVALVVGSLVLATLIAEWWMGGDDPEEENDA